MNPVSRSARRLTISLLALSALLAGSFTLLAGSAHALYRSPDQGPAPAPANPAPVVDCSRIKELGLDRMMNLAAGHILIDCGQSQGGPPPRLAALAPSLQRLSPFAY